MDFIRRVKTGRFRIEDQVSRGIDLTGHHELLFPLLAAAILEKLQSKK
jgi:hypothetical protein